MFNNIRNSGVGS
jgi:hypothetical protein